MMRKGLMKRLSKSASDISACTRKTHSTSPEEESKCFDPDQGIEDTQDHHLRKKEDQRFRSHCNVNEPCRLERSPVGSRTRLGFLNYLKQRLTRSTRDEPPVDETASSYVTPILGRRHSASRFARNEDNFRSLGHETGSETPEIVRYRHGRANQDPIDSEVRPEVVRHQYVTPLTGLPMALAQELEMAQQKEVVDVNDPIHQMGMSFEHPPSEATKTSMTSQNSQEDSYHSTQDDHLTKLKAHQFYLLHVHLKQGFDLAARDSNGSSDPYVKFVYKGKVVHKSKTVHKDLNPLWDEQFVLPIDDPFQPVVVKVYDYDWAFRDDFMGEATIVLTRLELEKPHEVVLSLSETGNSTEYLGQLALAVILEPRRPHTRSNSIVSLLSTFSSAQHQFRGRSDSMKKSNMSSGGGGGGSRSASWVAVVNVVLVEGVDLLAMDLEGTSDPYCKFRLGNERYKSKPVFTSLNPKWHEQFDLYLFPDQSQEMEITVWDKDQRSKDDFMGRCSIDLSILTRDYTHDIWRSLEDGAGKLHMLVTISGLTYDPDLGSYGDEPDAPFPNLTEGISDVKKREFCLKQTFSNWNDIGFVKVKLFCAKGLYAADLGGKSDPYVVLELDNQRLQTHTEYKTINPTWNRVFALTVKDIHSVLDITVFDEDRNHSFEFLGRLSIPLLRIEPGRKRWFALKDKKLRCRAKGVNPQIMMELDLVWNPMRAAIRTLNPREEKYMQMSEKFKRQIFLNNVMRIKAIIMEFVNLGKFVESCLEWEHPIRSVIAFIAFLVITYFFQPYMFPIGLLLIFLKNYVIMSYLEASQHQHADQELLDDLEEEDLDDKEEEKEEKKSLKARLQAIQEVTAMVQNAIGYVASLGEEVKNTFNFSVPYLSWLAIIILVVIALILYFISLRFLVIVWGINKFTKKLIRPNTVTNNELLDFLSRVPDDEELQDFRELRVQVDDPGASGSNKKGQTQKKKQKQT